MARSSERSLSSATVNNSTMTMRQRPRHRCWTLSSLLCDFQVQSLQETTVSPVPLNQSRTEEEQ